MKPIALLVMGLVVLFGCCGYQGPSKYTGGGWIEVCNLPDFPPDSNGPIITLDEMFNCPCDETGKATFGFQFRGMTDDICSGATVSGQLQWVDHLNRVRFHGIVDDFMMSCSGGICFGDADCVLGTYRTQPTNLGPGGDFQLCVRDYGEPGPTEGDKISIRVTSGYYEGYKIKGTWLGGGNIQAHYDE